MRLYLCDSRTELYARKRQMKGVILSSTTLVRNGFLSRRVGQLSRKVNPKSRYYLIWSIQNKTPDRGTCQVGIKPIFLVGARVELSVQCRLQVGKLQIIHYVCRMQMNCELLLGIVLWIKLSFKKKTHWNNETKLGSCLNYKFAKCLEYLPITYGIEFS